MSDHTLIPKGHNALGSKRSFLLFILLISILSVSWELTTVLGDMDEIRNFNLSRGIVMGYVPYRDFNMVMTPLFNLLFAIPLIFSKTLIVYRVTSALMWIATYICFYKLCTHYFDNRAATLLCVSSILLSTQFTYNSLVFLFAILMLLILTNEESYKNDYIMCAHDGTCHREHHDKSTKHSHTSRKHYVFVFRVFIYADGSRSSSGAWFFYL